MFRAVHVLCVFVCVSVSSCIVCVPFLEYECRYASISVCSILESVCIFRIRVCYIVSLCVFYFYNVCVFLCMCVVLHCVYVYVYVCVLR